METVLQNGNILINLITAVIAIVFWLASLFHVSRQNKADIAEIRSELRQESKELRGDIAAVRIELASLRERIDCKFEAIMERLNRT